MSDHFQDVRSLDQNSLLHLICGDVAGQREWAGQMIDTEGWKRLFVDAWCRETGRSPGKVVPSLDGESVVVLNRSTRGLGKKSFSELLEWTFAWCAQNDIRLRAHPAYDSFREAQVA